MQIIGIIGIIAAFVFLFYFSYKGANLSYLSLIACLIIIVTNGMPLIDTIENVVMSGVAAQGASLLLIYLFGAILGALFVNSGGATSIAFGLLNLFGKKADDKKRQRIGIVIAFVIGAALTYSGIDNFSVIFTMIAIVSGIMRSTNIPRKYLPVLLIAPTAIGALLPGSLYISSLVCSSVLGVSPSSGLIPGLIAAVFVAGLSFFYLSRIISRDTAQGLTWQESEGAPNEASVEKGSNPIVACLPLLGVVISYNAFGLPAWLALVIGILLAVVLFYPNLNGNGFLGKMDSLKETFNQGAGNAGIPCVMLISFGLAFCIQGSAAYTVISDFFVSVSLPAALSLALVSTIMVGASCGPAGMMVAAMLAMNTFIPAGMISGEAALRILVTTATVFDTLPCFPGPATIMALSGVSPKEGYRPVGMTTVLFTGIAVVIVTVLYIIFPGII